MKKVVAKNLFASIITVARLNWVSNVELYIIIIDTCWASGKMHIMPNSVVI